METFLYFCLKVLVQQGAAWRPVTNKQQYIMEKTNVAAEIVAAETVTTKNVAAENTSTENAAVKTETAKTEAGKMFEKIAVNFLTRNTVKAVKFGQLTLGEKLAYLESLPIESLPETVSFSVSVPFNKLSKDLQIEYGRFCSANHCWDKLEKCYNNGNTVATFTGVRPFSEGNRVQKVSALAKALNVTSETTCSVKTLGAGNLKEFCTYVLTNWDNLTAIAAGKTPEAEEEAETE